MKDMEGFLNCSILDEIFETRQEEFSHKVIETSEDYMKLIEETETRLKSILNYVPAEHYKAVEKDIDDFLFDNFLGMAEFWNRNYYKLGFIDGMNVKKEISEIMEVELNEKSNG